MTNAHVTLTTAKGRQTSVGAAGPSDVNPRDGRHHHHVVRQSGPRGWNVRDAGTVSHQYVATA